MVKGPVSLEVLVPAQASDGRVVLEPLPAGLVEVAEADAEPPELAWPAPVTLPNREVDQELEIRFDAVSTQQGLRWRLNGQVTPSAPLFTIPAGQLVRFRLRNMEGPEHPFHLHGQFFEIVADGRRETEQPGLKDTVLVPGQSTVTIRAFMENPGLWMAHCHILEHAELGMMATIQVDP